jgi:predicted ester cyclase
VSIETSKKIVCRYFEEAVDQGRVDLLEELFTPDCIIHRPEAQEPLKGLEGIRGVITGVADKYSDFKTTIYDLIGEGDRVVARLSHRAVQRGEWKSRIGRHAVDGKIVDWSAIAIFQIKDGKIAEEWVCRDELGMLIQLGVIQIAS